MTRFCQQNFTINSKWIIWNLQLEITGRIFYKFVFVCFVCVCVWCYIYLKWQKYPLSILQWCTKHFQTKQLSGNVTNLSKNLNAMRNLSGEIFCLMKKLSIGQSRKIADAKIFVPNNSKRDAPLEDSCLYRLQTARHFTRSLTVSL